MRAYFVLLMLLVVKVFTRLFYRLDMSFLGDVPADPWRNIRLVAVLNHTSLFEVLFSAGCPLHFLWRVARHGVVPIAQKTAGRPLVGSFYKLIANRVIAISRERDESWTKVLRNIDEDAMMMILPEGRMKRATGLDADGKPMTVRGGIADLIELTGEGRMLLGYSGGLHHVQVPGERFPRLFKTLRMRLEVVDIARYRQEMEAVAGLRGFRRAVVQDMERRRDLYCPVDPESSRQPSQPPQPREAPATEPTGSPADSPG